MKRRDDSKNGETVPGSVDRLAEGLRWVQLLLRLGQSFRPVLFAAELGTFRECGAGDDPLVLGLGDGVLELLPGRVRAVAKATGSFDATSLETLRAACHAEGLLRLGLVLRRLHDPVLVLFLLLSEDFGIARRHPLRLARRPKLDCFVVGESERFLTT